MSQSTQHKVAFWFIQCNVKCYNTDSSRLMLTTLSILRWQCEWMIDITLDTRQLLMLSVHLLPPTITNFETAMKATSDVLNNGGFFPATFSNWNPDALFIFIWRYSILCRHRVVVCKFYRALEEERGMETPSLFLSTSMGLAVTSRLNRIEFECTGNVCYGGAFILKWTLLGKCTFWNTINFSR